MQAVESQIQSTTPVQRCTIRVLGGHYVTEGIAVLIARSDGTEARVTELTEPGALLMAYVGRGIHRFLVSLEDGGDFESELLDTSWHSSGRRLCRFALAAPLDVAQ